MATDKVQRYTAFMLCTPHEELAFVHNLKCEKYPEIHLTYDGRRIDCGEFNVKMKWCHTSTDQAVVFYSIVDCNQNMTIEALAAHVHYCRYVTVGGREICQYIGKLEDVPEFRDWAKQYNESTNYKRSEHSQTITKPVPNMTLEEENQKLKQELAAIKQQVRDLHKSAMEINKGIIGNVTCLRDSPNELFVSMFKPNK